MREFIERVIESGLLVSALVELAQCGASRDDLASAPPLPADLRDLLVWRNGLNLDVVRISGVGQCPDPVREEVLPGEGPVVVFGSDPVGFVYFCRTDGSIGVLDTDGGEIRTVAASFREFVREYVFGSRAVEFGGAEWAREVNAALNQS